MFKSRSSRVNLGLISGVLLLVAVPLIMLRDAEFAGADTQAEAVITEIKPDYQPWANPIFTPSSGEIESLLFAVQAGIGAGIIGYVIGWYRGKNQAKSAVVPISQKSES